MVKHSATDTLLAAPGENRVALRGMDWVAYCQMRSLLNERTRARLTYDRGTLEITMPSEAHEFYARLIERFIIILVVELGRRDKAVEKHPKWRRALKAGGIELIKVLCAPIGVPLEMARVYLEDEE